MRNARIVMTKIHESAYGWTGPWEDLQVYKRRPLEHQNIH